MFKLNTPPWKLETTLGNIQLIQHSTKPRERPDPEEEIFNFWLEYFDNATRDQTGDEIKFPILIWEPNKVCLECCVGEMCFKTLLLPGFYAKLGNCQ